MIPVLFVKARMHKYVKREGTPGHYRYWYRDASGRLVEGKEPKAAVPVQKREIEFDIGEKVDLAEVREIISGSDRGLDKLMEMIRKDPVRKRRENFERKKESFYKTKNDFLAKHGILGVVSQNWKKSDYLFHSGLYDGDYQFIIKTEEEYADFKEVLDWGVNYETLEKPGHTHADFLMDIKDKYKDSNPDLSRLLNSIETDHPEVLKAAQVLNLKDFEYLCTLERASRSLSAEEGEVIGEYQKHVQELRFVYDNFDNSRVDVRAELKSALHTMQPGGHWGAAEAKNPTAKAVCIVSDTGQYNPVDYFNDSEYKPKFTLDQIILGAKLRNYAQDKLKSFPKEKHPFVYRGMHLTEDDVKDLELNKVFKLTGCTAFTFYEKIASHYSSSTWTEEHSERGSVPIMLRLKRTQGFDNSVGMWHEKKDSEVGIDATGDNPAFEILTGLTKMKVVSVQKQGKGYLIEVEA